ncbi:hypothetical protein [Phenylobacterium sp.]|uniref:hypothetical protein n=1 Tax=Phenylobacterium sp. TaxID=1871053 RepID=UPI0035B1C8C8
MFSARLTGDSEEPGRSHAIRAACLIAALLLAAPAAASGADGADRPIEARPADNSCRDYADGSSRCVGPDGHVRIERLDENGRRRTTSTDPKLWGTSNGDGSGITPPPGLLDHRPEYRREAYGRVTEPWTAPRTAPAKPSSSGVQVPGSDGCSVAGGQMRCRR